MLAALAVVGVSPAKLRTRRDSAASAKDAHLSYWPEKALLWHTLPVQKPAGGYWPPGAEKTMSLSVLSWAHPDCQSQAS